MKTKTKNSLFSSIDISALVPTNFASLFDWQGNQFVGLTYRNKQGELARHVLQVGVSLESLYRKDRDTLTSLLDSYEGELAREAIESLLTSLNRSILAIETNTKNEAYTCKDTYEETLWPNVKAHKETGVLYVSGVSVFRETLEEGEPQKPANSKPLTIAKNQIEKDHLRKYWWRQFTLDKNQVQGIRVNGVVIS